MCGTVFLGVVDGNGERTLRFKLLLNDELWSQGENLVVSAGGRIEAAPCF